MARRFTWSGQIWTDAHGFACVELPAAVDGEFVVELRTLADGANAALRADPTPRRFTIETDEPHVKVAWRVTARQPHPRKAHREEK